MISQKATKIDLFNFTTPQMRAFHLAWMAFFVLRGNQDENARQSG